jgi:hypothetical protein
MAAIDFPNAPAANQVFNAPNGVAYIWTGSIWKVYSPAALLPTAAPTFDMTNATFPAVGVIPFDDTIPQISEGARVFQRVFTAQNAGNPIDVDAEIVTGTGGAGVNYGLCLFIDNAPDAVAAKAMNVNVAQALVPLRIRWRGVLAAGTHTFELRYGGGSAAYINRNDSGRFYGGALQATMSITEVGVGAQGPPGVQGPPGLGNVVLQTAVKQSLVTGNIIGTFNSGQLTPFLISQGAALDSINFTPMSATSKIEVEGTFKGNGNATECWTLALFNGSTYVDCQQCYIGAGNVIQQTLPFKTVMPSPGTAAMTLNFRLGGNSAQTWRQGQTNDGATSQNNPNIKSWMVVRELGP